MNETNLKEAVSVAEMARMVGLSRARFYQLQRDGVFPSPVYCICTHRPLYTEEQQGICIEVKRRNFGINSRPILFYTARGISRPRPAARRSRPTSAPANGRHVELVESLKALGLGSVTAAQVERAVALAFPAGTAGIDEAEQVRAVFLHLRRQN